jgi:CIC family chloride channel protein
MSGEYPQGNTLRGIQWEYSFVALDRIRVGNDGLLSNNPKAASVIALPYKITTDNKKTRQVLEKLRIKLAEVDALPQLALLGVCSGLVSGMVILLFRLVFETAQISFLPAANPENYEALSVTWRFFLPVLGGFCIGILFQLMPKDTVQIGVVHVLERLIYHQGYLPVKNFLLQFIGAAISIVCGHSVGREGPGIHLGAASSSFLGQVLRLPNNSMRILVACGAAASIAASFNTPIAGVIFAMEVIVMEYTLAGFTPVILATVSATVLMRSVYGDDPAFIVPPLQLGSLQELPIVIIMGVAIGALAALFILLLQSATKYTAKLPIWQKTTLAGLLVGLLAIPTPQIMGIGYDTVNLAMSGQIALLILGAIITAKLLATSIGIGCGLPGGLIGPLFVIGSAAGGIMGVVAHWIFGSEASSAGFYAMIGMGAMMGATLQAPLAALMAMLELTVNTHIILPGMLAVVTAGITSSQLFNKQGVFLILLKAKGLDYRDDPIAQSLRRVGVVSKMNRSFVRANRVIDRAAAQNLLLKEPQWIVVEEEANPLALLLSTDLLHYITSQQQEEIDLLKIPGQRYDSQQINMRATLQQALDLMNLKQVDAVFVGTSDSAGHTVVHGILTRQVIESHYRYK